MKMRFVILCYALLLTGTAFAQQLKVGLNLANVSVTDNGRVEDANMLTSFHVGFVGNVGLGKVVAFQPGILFTGKGAKTQSGDPSSANYYKATSHPYYIEVPVNLVFKAPIGIGSLFVGAGPYAAVGIGGKNKAEGKYLGVGFESARSIQFSDDDPTTLNYEEGAGFGIMRRFDYGLNGVAGIEGKSTIISVGYGLGLAKLQSGANNSEDNNNKHRVLSFSVGFKL